jgi:4a-hydroxytetrahydrobiopterin dehydratase
MPKLRDEEIRAALPAGWRLDGDAVVKEFRCKGFTGAVAFAQTLVEPANAARHHPDLAVGYGRVTVRLSTHDEGGVTDKDIDLARTIEALAAEAGIGAASGSADGT